MLYEGCCTEGEVLGGVLGTVEELNRGVLG